MDALSKIFDDIHLHQSEYMYLNPQGDWSFQYRDQGAMLAYVVLQGSLHIHLSAQTHLHIDAGDIVLIPSGCSHYASATADTHWTEHFDISDLFQIQSQQSINFGTINHTQAEDAFILVIQCHMDTTMAKPLLSALPEYLHIPHIMCSTAPEWLQIGLQFLAVESHQIRPGRDKILDHLVSILLIECVRDYIFQLDDSNNWLGALAHPELSNALAAIHGQPEKAWTVESLAEQCCMSRSKFANLFNQVIGEPPLAYLQQHRLRLASHYLQQGQLSIQQIAHRVGYSSETAFSQTFKKQFELTPSQYRQQFQNNNAITK